MYIFLLRKFVGISTGSERTAAIDRYENRGSFSVRIEMVKCGCSNSTGVVDALTFSVPLSGFLKNLIYFSSHLI